MVTSIVVKLELGHVAQVRDVPTLAGHTHDWMVFAKGANGIDIEHFVEKVVFWLHESYSPSKHVIKSPPYEVRQTGYAGFNILIEVYFKNKTDPKKVEFNYDMFLHTESMPPVNHTRIEMLTFTSPAEDFKKKLVKAGGSLKIEGQQAPREKRPKESRQSEKQRPSAKESSDVPKKIKSGEKLPKKSSSKESWQKRRSSIGEAEPVKKKKNEDKLNATIPLEKKPKEKLNKIKIKIEKGGQPTLFAREESIDIKQIKKKDPIKKEEVRKSSKNRNSPIQVKIKKESIEKPEKYQEKKKKEKKHSLDTSKIKQELKVKKRRTMSSSDSDNFPSVDHHQKALRSDGSEDEKPVKKRHKSERKESKKSSTKKVRRDSLVDNTEVMDMDISATPPRVCVVHPTVQPPTQHKEKKHKSSKSKEKTKSMPSSKSHKESKTKISPNRKPKKEKSRRSSSKHKESIFNLENKKLVLSPTVDSAFDVSPDASPSESDDERTIPEAVFGAVIHSPQAEPPRVPPSPPKPTDDVMSDDSMMSSIHADPASDSDGGLFEPIESQPRHKESSQALRRSGSPPPRHVARQPSPLVTVTVGTELKSFPGLTLDLFEQLKILHTSLAKVDDVMVKKKVASIVRKSGKFSMEEGEMNFDLCSLDLHTIQRIKKHLKVN